MVNIEQLRADLAATEAELTEFDATPLERTDPGSHSYRKHLTPRQADRDTERSLAGYRRQAEARKRLTGRVTKARQALAAAERPGPVDPATIPGAWAVRTGTRWHEVVRVNAKTVTVKTGYSWTDRIPFEKVTAVRHREGS